MKSLEIIQIYSLSPGVQVRAEGVVPSENDCKPYIEKAIHELKGDSETGEWPVDV